MDHGFGIWLLFPNLFSLSFPFFGLSFSQDSNRPPSPFFLKVDLNLNSFSGHLKITGNYKSTGNFRGEYVPYLINLLLSNSYVNADALHTLQNISWLTACF